MQDKLLFEYAVIRIVPRVDREEFLNAGVILYCAKPKFLKAIYQIDEKRFACFCSEISAAELNEYLETFVRISNGENDAGPIARLPVSERFRWLTAKRSTIIQTSKVHPGFCIDPGETLQKLFRQLVL